jgi:hypothetical protein
VPVLWLTPSSRPPNVLTIVGPPRARRATRAAVIGRNVYAATFTATYDATLARVRLTATGLYGVGHVEIVRFDTATFTNAEDVRGGNLAPAAGTVRVDDYEFTDGVANTYQLRIYDGAGTLLSSLTATVTPVLGGVWLKSVARPFLNQTVTVVDFGELTRPARGGVFEVLGRRLPIAVTEVRGSRRYELVLYAAARADVDALALFLSFGDTVYLHVPHGCVVPASGHFYVGDVSEVRPPKHDSLARRFVLPLTEVDAPDETIVGATITWAGVVAAYPTWADVIAAKATWLDLQESISDPGDEVVG